MAFISKLPSDDMCYLLQGFMWRILLVVAKDMWACGICALRGSFASGDWEGLQSPPVCRKSCILFWFEQFRRNYTVPIVLHNHPPPKVEAPKTDQIREFAIIREGDCWMVIFPGRGNRNHEECQFFGKFWTNFGIDTNFWMKIFTFTHNQHIGFPKTDQVKTESWP